MDSRLGRFTELSSGTVLNVDDYVVVFMDRIPCVMRWGDLTASLVADSDLSVFATAAALTAGLATKQPLDATLTALAGLATGADKLPYATGTDTFAQADLTAFARTLLDDANAGTARATLGVVIGTDVQAYDADLAAIAALTSAADQLPYATGAGTWAMTTLSSFARTLLDDNTALAARATLQAMSVSPASVLASGTLGYTTGAGGAVTQVTSKSTSVTLNTACGIITTHNAALAAGSTAAFTVNNSAVAEADLVTAHVSANANYTVQVSRVSGGGGSFNLRLTNVTGGSLSEAVQINFLVLKGSTT